MKKKDTFIKNKIYNHFMNNGKKFLSEKFFLKSLKILQSRKVPFVVALNKCDQLSGWRKSETPFISKAIKEQDQSIQNDLDQKIYDVVGTLSVLGYQSEAFYRVTDFKSEVAIVPISARSGVGIPELLSVLVGLTQQYLQKRLNQEEKDPRGIVLEVNDEFSFTEHKSDEDYAG